VPLGILAATRPGSLDRPRLPHRLDRRRLAAGVLHRTAPGLRLLLSARLGAGAAGAARHLLQPPPHVTGFYLIDSLIAGDLETFRARSAQLVLPALTLGDLLARADRPHDPGLDAGRARLGLRAHRARERAQPAQVIVTYAFRNAMLPVVTTLGMVFSFLLGANVLVEKVFAWPGIGSYAVEALIAVRLRADPGLRADHGDPLRALNLAIDLLYGVIDPRVRLEG
jgi:hypothetical protein